jgi:hypothetical protein
MRPAARTTIPVVSSATHAAVATRKRRLRPGSARPVATVARNDTPNPLAITSCITPLTGIGTSPIAVRWRPAEMIAARNARRVRRRVRTGRASDTKTPYAARRKPENSTPELNVRPEKSEYVPS